MKLLTLATALIIAATALSAKTIQYPQAECAEILSSEYSSGNGDSAFHQFEILCKDNRGVYRVFAATWGSVAGFIGMGRISMESVITLEPYNGPTLKVK